MRASRLLFLSCKPPQEIPHSFARRNGLGDAWRRELVDVSLRLEVARKVALNADILAHVTRNRCIKAVEVPAGAEELLKIGADHPAGCTAAQIRECLRAAARSKA